MYKIFYTLLLIFNTTICSNADAQKISNKVLSKYPHSLSINMYNDVLSKMDIPEDLQVNLALLYTKRDSLIFEQLVKPTPGINYSRYSDSLLYAIEIQFKKLLTAPQKGEYFLKVERARAVNFPIVQDTIYMDIEMDSQFGLALALYEKFKLKPKQKDSLLYYATLLKQKENYTKLNPDSGYFDKAAFESEYMAKVLTEQEYNGLLSIKNKLIAESRSRDTWYKLKRENLVSTVGRDDTIFRLKMYYLLQASIWDKLANQPRMRAAAMQNLRLPQILQKYYALKNDTETKLQKYNW